MDRSDLGTRMKRYEVASRTYLTRRMPVIMRIDGRAFHSFTRGFQRPFDPVLRAAMKNTMLLLCKEIQGCVLGYTQSDEITLVLVDYQTLTSDAWFDYEVQKICSIGASAATVFFLKNFKAAYDEWFSLYGDCSPADRIMTYERAMEKMPMFDCRAFNVPKEDVCNNLIWRQQDATRNSIQSVGQAFFSHKELQGKSCKDIQDMLFKQKEINWNDYATEYKRGCCCIKNADGSWVIDEEIPIFSQDRAYIESRIYPESTRLDVIRRMPAKELARMLVSYEDADEPRYHSPGGAICYDEETAIEDCLEWLEGNDGDIK